MSLQATVSTLGTPPAPALTLANVLYEKRGAIAYVTINRPKVLNALNTPTWKDMRTAFEDARDDASVRGVILTGAGDRAFIAGADIGELVQVTAFAADGALLEAAYFGLCATTEDKKEGTTAFLERRAPRFQGR
jgi:enoyl-CoA hydratase/carnithine racemase